MMIFTYFADKLIYYVIYIKNIINNIIKNCNGNG